METMQWLEAGLVVLMVGDIRVTQNGESVCIGAAILADVELQLSTTV